MSETTTNDKTLRQKTSDAISGAGKKISETASKVSKHLGDNKGKYGIGAGLAGAGAIAAAASGRGKDNTLGKEAADEKTLKEKASDAISGAGKKISETAGKVSKHIGDNKGKYGIGAAVAGTGGIAAAMSGRGKDE